MHTYELISGILFLNGKAHGTRQVQNNGTAYKSFCTHGLFNYPFIVNVLFAMRFKSGLFISYPQRL